jgi:beta,beta-carotene 9',10'-dioxygenase
VRSLGFRSLDQELREAALPVEGTFPAWLTGALLRTGPAKFEVGRQSYNHWFDGLAMLHRFAFSGGQVTYTNRFLESPAYRSARDTGKMTYSEFATDPCRSLFKRVMTLFSSPSFGDNANVNVVRSGAEFLALTETPLPVVFDPKTLDTVGVAASAPGNLTIAHPHQSPKAAELISYAVHFGPRSTYQVYARARGGGPPRVVVQIPVQLPAYMHSFAVTEHYAVLAEFPFTAIPAMIPLSGRPFIENYRWRPGHGTRFSVVDLATGQLRGTYQGEPFFAFHHVNAFERDGDIFVDLSAYDNADIVSALYLDRLRTDGFQPPVPELRRYRVSLSGGEVTREPLVAAPLDLPRIDYARHNGRPYRYVYGAGGDGGFLQQVIKADLEGGSYAAWAEAGCYPGEPVFVRSPGTEREDAGVLLSVVLDSAAGTSFLLALDAADLSEIGRARVPHHIPHGFHGDFFAEPLAG